MERAEFLRKLGFGSLMVAAGQSLISCMHGMDMNVVPSQLDEGQFLNKLPVPETIYSGSELLAQNAISKLDAIKESNVLGYHAGILGPTIRVRSQDLFSLKFRNGLSEKTNIHWHGLLTPDTMDGGPDLRINANAEFEYNFKINQGTGTNWYHPHIHQNTARQVVNGLAGLFIVESDLENQLNLPHGDFEIPIVIQDKLISSDGNIIYNPDMMQTMTGYLGDTLLVNGIKSPFIEVSQNLYRLRVLNGSNARIYNLTLSTESTFHIIGADSSLLEIPVEVKSVLLAPGERLDLLVNFNSASVGERIFLRSETFSGMGDAQGSQAFNILQFKVTSGVKMEFSIPEKLLTLSNIGAETALRTFKFTMTMGSMNAMHRINGKSYNMNRIDETVKHLDTEIWEFDNSSGDEPHPMHIHGVQFKIVSRTGKQNTIQPHERGLKDTVLVGPGEKVQVKMKFELKGKFVFHCHNLEHEDDGMMLNFQVS
ncbi:multicopper oxidase family protein [Jiulongibacter sediminis]|uniref:Bilirubin oxidase n=1 Tax=Jiulongibacter sediminis TaxID=1605367 RepID=A0A0P7BZL3_9BACT|nr:multicopper oxidase domain-containing protein [Jiulongibacter sediminis]KPM46581.1 hypothetical protein AFM12_19175 [Jiulongibacter sediminis]TBX21154.1 hypothetical protein TK44_19180 [Jiulongibacter sediminis]